MVSHRKKQHMDFTTEHLSLSICGMCLGYEAISYSQITYVMYFHQPLNASTYLCHYNDYIRDWKDAERSHIVSHCQTSLGGEINPIWQGRSECSLLTMWAVGTLGAVMASLTRDSSVAQLSSRMKHGFLTAAWWKCNSWGDETQSRFLHIPHGWHLSDFTFGIVFPQVFIHCQWLARVKA